MSAFQFATKAQTLLSLKHLLREAVVLDGVYFTVAQWQTDPTGCLTKIKQQLGEVCLVVRSSALSEDGASQSHAGMFASRLGVDGAQEILLIEAIQAVVASMCGSPLDEVLVQPMASDVLVNGVIMTCDVMHGAPYYVINYDDETGSTDCVTAGRGISKSLRVYRGAPDEYIQSPRILRFLRLAKELEAICGTNALDIEFGLSAAQTLILFQVRRIATEARWHPVTERRVARQLSQVECYIQSQMRPRPEMLGARTLYGIMPDWNPAEILGASPRPLAVSLYRFLITASTWRRARVALGYRDVPHTELMVVLNNHPYIDVRASLNSLLPAALPSDVGARLVDACLQRLEDFPELHDKLEFDIIPTCYTFTFQEDWRARFAHLPESDYRELAQSSRALTQNLLDLSAGSTLKQALGWAESLQKDWGSQLQKKTSDALALLASARALLMQCRDAGTLPFAMVARHAFVAEALLRSAVQRGALSQSRLGQFKRSIRTVTSDLLAKHAAVCQGQLSQRDFLAQFGHLRPSTYDITSLRYDERDGLFIGEGRHIVTEASSFEATSAELAALNKLLKEAQLGECDAQSLLAYARCAIAGRESVKFGFTRVLSDALSLLLQWGELQGLSRNDLSFLRWEDITRLLIEPPVDEPDRVLLALAQQGEHRFAEAKAFYLSHLLRGARDVYVATLHRSEANYIGHGMVAAASVLLDAHSSVSTNLYGKIVCIENADPGFDWIFTRGVIGLVTKFGGANSHMAIRCAELGLPAAIGCGEQMFERLIRAGALELNVTSRFLRPLHGGDA